MEGLVIFFLVFILFYWGQIVGWCVDHLLSWTFTPKKGKSDGGQ